MLQEYLEAQVETANPYRLHLLTVEATIRWMQRAEIAYAQQDWLGWEQGLSRARAGVTELLAGLNPDHQPELVASLKNSFLFVYRQLALAEVTRDNERLASAQRMLQQHRETWLELGQRLAATAGDQNADAVV